MSLDFRNINTLWSSVLTETLSRLGLATAIVCPGSRSGPLAVAFAAQANLEAIPVLDERSAAFFALGIARRSGLPVVLVCTSGTAGANFYPAVIEAAASRVPLLILTADRPPELRDCHAGQAIDQVKLYGHYPRWQVELALPDSQPTMLAYLRQTLVHAWERSQWPVAGPVHLNIPLRDPLAPVTDPATEALAIDFNAEHFFAHLYPRSPATTALDPQALKSWLQTWQTCDRGLIIAGPAQPSAPERYCEAVALLARNLSWPVLAEGLSPLRNWADINPSLIATYDLLLRHPDLTAQLQPQQVICLGELPTSKVLRAWLIHCQPQTWILNSTGQNVDALHSRAIHLSIQVEALTSHLKLLELQPPTAPSSWPPYAQAWLTAEQNMRTTINSAMQQQTGLLESKVAWLLSQSLPAGTPLFIANSMPIRDVEYFWQPGRLRVQPYFNRGANGIDGTLSTALGISHHQPSSVLLTGDLALLHDTNGFLLRNHWQGHLTIIVINNNGGGIFQMLPIVGFDPPFLNYFQTPQYIDFQQLASTYGIGWEKIQSWQHLTSCLRDLPARGIRILELNCNGQDDMQWRKRLLDQGAEAI
ncbi:2-succinyl-5-enolpyruvyl-6-hydroxy-3-cyclohexene-1-carboxylic-acid synthase [Acaryochloris sp. IP29b_bin.148]|uniref:2-succinyl-5-enolpyruvyl-6-hydroxy-3- cyclohexene-1-carboxylic-acid synthase n=1 Tax=Acaryochloris sp. IP29b_bin.148 TaxID=2969218 RepID=UPI0026037CB4|nr:2-succinyl-5-enolpyruvyl-6-hydroxy-3-cyclohexene-1-carboxylic-acid synthase [Acaryochloris sp. IP29b_bin.148]